MYSAEPANIYLYVCKAVFTCEWRTILTHVLVFLTRSMQVSRDLQCTRLQLSQTLAVANLLLIKKNAQNHFLQMVLLYSHLLLAISNCDFLQHCFVSIQCLIQYWACTLIVLHPVMVRAIYYYCPHARFIVTLAVYSEISIS